ncbi:alpha/beta fold hydrolase [Ferribacterium limneticum]|uniref:alpha/beta fold hydrolase n=1 Tax=Ferribacterium limneticum TaxID=76259 RepID=UPI001CF84656|nr:alpha/beta hydrolase [Ferribacterium limneticum]UCV24162.1 alpha/beta hydrolase [Ferribacterium limneticum]
MKPNILLLPGLLNDASVFTDQVAALSAMSTVEVGDLSIAETIPELAASVLKLASAKHFVLLGLSLGGYVAFEIMRQAPERVSGLVLMDTTARPDTPEASAKREALIKLAATDLDAVTEQLLPLLSHPDRINQPAVRGVIQSMASSLGKEIFERQQRAIIGRPDSRPTLKSITCPTLVICGQDDQITPPELAKEMATGIKHAKLELIAQCGHLATLDQPELVCGLLLDWIKDKKF